MHVDAVLQSQITEQQPNVVISPISNSTVVEIKQAVIEQPKEEVVAASVDDDAAKPSESTGDNATADQQPAPVGTETQTPLETPPSSTDETGTTPETPESGTGDSAEAPAAESEPAPAPTT